jgi:hypothetical protein
MNSKGLSKGLNSTPPPPFPCARTAYLQLQWWCICSLQETRHFLHSKTKIPLYPASQAGTETLRTFLIPQLQPYVHAPPSTTVAQSLVRASAPQLPCGPPPSPAGDRSLSMLDSLGGGLYHVRYFVQYHSSSWRLSVRWEK